MSETTTNKETNTKTKKVYASPDFAGLGTFIKEQNELLKESTKAEMEAYSEAADKVVRAEKRIREEMEKTHSTELTRLKKAYESQFEVQKELSDIRFENQRNRHKTAIEEQTRKQEADELQWKRSAGVWGILVVAVSLFSWNLVFLAEYVVNNIIN